MTAPIPLTDWQAANTPDSLPRHIRRSIKPGVGGCWIWSRALSRDGYGWTSLDDKTYQAHRLVYTLIAGPVADGLHLDHLCRVRHCVRPDHLEPVTPRENLLRGDTPTGWDSCQRCGSEFVQVRAQRRCPKCLAEYEARRAESDRLTHRSRKRKTKELA